MDGWNEAHVRVLVLVACCVNDTFAKWSIVVPGCMAVGPGNIPRAKMDPGILPGSNRL